MADEMKRVFTEIYENGGWNSPNDESVSGTGSTLHWSRPLREQLPGLLRELNVRTLLDAPCGDFNWMKTVDLDGVDYIGIDIVPDLIALNRALYAGPVRRFEVANIVSDPLPAADLVMTRDFLLHVPNDAIWGFLENFIASDIRYLLATTYPQDSNEEIRRVGSWRFVNLTVAPFNLPEPRRKLLDTPPKRQQIRHLGLWTSDDVAQTLTARGAA
ncbi:MAG: class I SAM-dependent methyltransferase [Pseudomonadota bacterium]